MEPTEIIDGSKKRKADNAELEVDLTAPEPPSKKAARALRKSHSKVLPATTESERTDGEPDLQRLNGLEGERSEHGVWIGNLAFSTTKKDVFKFLTANDKITGQQITRIHLPTSSINKLQNKGFAYVDFDSADVVELALERSESLLGGRKLLIKNAKSFEGRPEQSKTKAQQQSQMKPPNRKIFVGNLAFDATKESIVKHFQVCGPIVSTQVATFEDSGKCKGYAWVEFESITSAENAVRGFVEVDDPKKKTGTRKIWVSRIEERTLRMEYAEDAKTRYDKRYGKNTKFQSEDEDMVEETQPSDDRGDERWSKRKAIGKISKELKADAAQKTGTSKPPARKSNAVQSRYDEKTVQKLTGAIVEGKGSKVVFD